jgi:hypothetical protein
MTPQRTWGSVRKAEQLVLERPIKHCCRILLQRLSAKPSLFCWVYPEAGPPYRSVSDARFETTVCFQRGFGLAREENGSMIAIPHAGLALCALSANNEKLSVGAVCRRILLARRGLGGEWVMLYHTQASSRDKHETGRIYYFCFHLARFKTSSFLSDQHN